MNSTNVSLWQMFLKRIRSIWKTFSNVFGNFSFQYPDFLQIIQLSFIYFFAVTDLIFAVFTNVLTLGYNPEILEPIRPIIQAILQSPILKLWASPEKVFFLSYLVLDLMVVRDLFKLKKLVKYNILLIFTLLMFQGLIMSYWDLLFHREISNSVVKWLYDRSGIISSDKSMAISFFLNTFIVFLVGYAYLYLRAIQGKFATIASMDWLTDSVAFWLRIKTPTMKFGKDKDKRK